MLMLATLLILIKAAGLPFINYTMYLEPNSTLVNINLPIIPIPGTLEVINDSDNSLIPFSLYNNGTLVIFAFGGGYVSILYDANYTYDQDTLTYYVNISSPIKFGLMFPPNIVMLNLPNNIISYTRINNSVEVTIPPGRYSLQYIYVPIQQSSTTTSSTPAPTTSTSSAPLPPPTTTTSRQASTTTTSTSATSTTVKPINQTTTTQFQSTTPTLSNNSSFPTSIAITIIVLVILAFIASMIMIRRRKSPLVSVSLDDVDEEIIRTLKDNGGTLYQSQLQQLTNIPKTTLWRHVQRLQDRGIVKIDKVNGQNRVTLIK
ncbi:MAG: winged helix-turn-helix transcriptional regulator [Thermocladium sp.]